MKWGSSTLKVIVGTWLPYQSESNLVEVKLIPNSSNPGGINTVLQQSGRTRYRIKATLKMASTDEYESLRLDKEAVTGRVLFDGDKINAVYYIDWLGPINKNEDGSYTAEIIFLEE